MKSLLLNIKNNFPYIFLIAIYFFFVNIEAKKEKNINNLNHKENETNLKKSVINDNNRTIPIQVIPYSQ